MLRNSSSLTLVFAEAVDSTDMGYHCEYDYKSFFMLHTISVCAVNEGQLLHSDCSLNFLQVQKSSINQSCAHIFKQLGIVLLGIVTGVNCL